MITAAYCSKELCEMLTRKGIEARFSMKFEKGGAWYKRYTLDVASRWLREVHLIFFDFTLILGDNVKHRFRIGVYQIKTDEEYADGVTYVWKKWVFGDSYEEVTEAAIRYCVEHLI